MNMKTPTKSKLSSSAEALRWFALPVDMKSTRNLAKVSRPTRPVIIPKVYAHGGGKVEEDHFE